MAGLRNASHAVYVEPDVPMLLPNGLTGAYANSHTRRPPVKPLIRGECVLGLNRGQDRLPGTREDCEPSVPLVLKFHATMHPYRVTQ